jgi:hypothetical protein
VRFLGKEEKRTMPRHGEIIEPVERFVTYAHTLDVSDEVLGTHGHEAVMRRIPLEAEARAREAAAKIDAYAPLVVTVGGVRTLPKPTPFVTRYGVHVRVEFQRYVYDATKRLAEEWERTKHRHGR